MIVERVVLGVEEEYEYDDLLVLLLLDDLPELDEPRPPRSDLSYFCPVHT